MAVIYKSQHEFRIQGDGITVSGTFLEVVYSIQICAVHTFFLDVVKVADGVIRVTEHELGMAGLTLCCCEKKVYVVVF